MMLGIVDFNRYTQQEAFDISVEGIRAQKYECSHDYGLCKYRGPGGKKCAVGFLIQDDEYDPKMEKFGSIKGLVRDACVLAGDEMVTLLSRLQYVHDDLAGEPLTPLEFKERFEKGFKKVAGLHNLMYTPPKDS